MQQIRHEIRPDGLLHCAYASYLTGRDGNICWSLDSICADWYINCTAYCWGGDGRADARRRQFVFQASMADVQIQDNDNSRLGFWSYKSCLT
jgi:hypothetical protein